MADPDARAVPWKWLAATLTVLVMGLLAAWGNDVTSRITLAQTQAAANNARISSIEASFQTILLRLDRIENKIDKIEERRK